MAGVFILDDEEMKLAIITYDTNHLKTEQVMINLALKGYDMTIFGLKFKTRPGRDVLFQHRPDQSNGVHAKNLAQHYNLPYVPVEHDYQIPDGFDYYLILGAGILSEEFIGDKKVINCHPGIIPNSRGLDSFKWAILHDRPLGITLHFIDKEVDAGELICVVGTPVFENDTLESLARRHYELEIDLISDFESYLSSEVNHFPDIQVEDALMRMPVSKEAELLNSVQSYIEKWS